MIQGLEFGYFFFFIGMVGLAVMLMLMLKTLTKFKVFKVAAILIYQLLVDRNKLDLLKGLLTC